MFDGIIEIRRDDDHVVVMNGVEDDKILYLKGTSSSSHNYANVLVVIFPRACYGMQDLVTLTMIVSKF